MILNTIIFFIIYKISFFSIYGYGKLFRNVFFAESPNKNEYDNEYINIFYGISFLIIISFFYHFLGIKAQTFNLLIIITGFLISLFYIKKIKYFLRFILIPISIFTSLIVFFNHDDFYLYHLQNIIELNSTKPPIGLGNLNIKYVYSSFYIYFESIFNFYNYKIELINIPRFLSFLAIVGYLFFNLFNKNKNQDKKFISFVFLIFILLKFKRFSEFGYDYPLTFFIIFIFVEYFYKSNSKNYKIRNILFLYGISFLIKVTALFFIPFILYSLFQYLKFQKLNNFKKNIFFPSIIILILFIINSFLNSGCLIYPIKESCYNKNQISWSVDKKELSDEQNIVENWSKGFFHQKNKDKIRETQEYTKNFNWVPNWILIHLIPKILEPILIFLLILIISYLINYKNKNYAKYLNNYIILSFLSLCLWFIVMPQLRFGYAYFLLNIFLIFNYFFGQTYILGNKFRIFLIISFVFFNISNIKRIYNDYYLTSKNTFPFYEIKNFKIEEKYFENYSYFTYKRNNNALRMINDNNSNIKFDYNIAFKDKNLEIKKKYIFKIISEKN